MVSKDNVFAKNDLILFWFASIIGFYLEVIKS